MKRYKIKITKEQIGKIKVTVPYNPIFIKKSKGIKEHRWNPEEKCWIFSHSNNVINSLFDIFKDEDVLIDPSLKKKEKVLFENLRREMASRKYSLKTIKAYIYYNIVYATSLSQ
ncbi:MAG: hypothetical protein J7J57_01230 [Caldisericaceae bacterium]|nr:hypothetical protein [Caldisericaceae bacterium]